MAQTGRWLYPASKAAITQLTRRREGYYVLYEVQGDRLIDLAYDIRHLGSP